VLAHILWGGAGKDCLIVIELVAHESTCDIVNCDICILRSGDRADIYVTELAWHHTEMVLISKTITGDISNGIIF
jgi:hypothetical protein